MRWVPASRAHRRHRLTHAAVAAGFQLLPEGLHVRQVQFVEGDGHLAYGVIPAEPVVIKDL